MPRGSGWLAGYSSLISVPAVREGEGETGREDKRKIKGGRAATRGADAGQVNIYTFILQSKPLDLEANRSAESSCRAVFDDGEEAQAPKKVRITDGT